MRVKSEWYIQKAGLLDEERGKPSGVQKQEKKKRATDSPVGARPTKEDTDCLSLNTISSSGTAKAP